MAAGGVDVPDLIKLMNWIKEADARLVAHVEWAVHVKKCKRVIIVSNDTDTFALLLRHIPHFMTLGLREIWQQFGTGEKRRMLPQHQVVYDLGMSMAKTVIKAHILSGDDCMSKVGTKHAAVVSDPGRYLSCFGGDDIMSDEEQELVDIYLIQLWVGVKSC